jgi:hypothetical protein
MGDASRKMKCPLDRDIYAAEPCQLKNLHHSLKPRLKIGLKFAATETFAKNPP